MNFNYLLNCIVSLSETKRFSQTFLTSNESVLEHTGAVCAISYFIALELKEENKNINLDIGDLLSKAVIHDFDEIVTGDVARPVKYHSEKMRNEFYEMEFENILKMSESIFEKEKLQDQISRAWQYSKYELSGLIVSFVDFICVIYKIHNEICVKNNFSVSKYFNNAYVERLSTHKNKINNELENQNFPESEIILKIFNSLNITIQEIQNKIENNNANMRRI